MKTVQLSPLSLEQIRELNQLYPTTGDVRLRTRTQIILLAAEQGMSAPAIAAIVPESDQTVRNWLKRYPAEGIEGLKEAPRPGAPNRVSPEDVAQQSGLRVSGETVRPYLEEAELVLSRPQHKISSPDPEYALKKGGEVFNYADEFNLSWRPTLRALWSPKGQPTKY